MSPCRPAPAHIHSVWLWLVDAMPLGSTRRDNHFSLITWRAKQLAYETIHRRWRDRQIIRTCSTGSTYKHHHHLIKLFAFLRNFHPMTKAECALRLFVAIFPRSIPHQPQQSVWPNGCGRANTYFATTTRLFCVIPFRICGWVRVAPPLYCPPKGVPVSFDRTHFHPLNTVHLILVCASPSLAKNFWVSTMAL